MEKLPHWDLSSIYHSITSEDFEHDLQQITPLVEQVRKQLQLGSQEKTDFSSWLIKLLDDYQLALDTTETLYAYASALLTVDTSNDQAMRALNRVEEALLPMKAVHVEFLNTLGSLHNEVLAALAADDRIKPYHFALKELLEEQAHTMSEAEENLAADLSRSGADAWGRLQEAISSTVDSEWDADQSARKTVIQLRSLAFDADREVRRKAYEAELAVWKQHEIAFAYALNGVKGTTISLEKRRGYRDPLQHAVMQARISDSILDALIGTIEKNLPLFRRYLRAKAHALELPKLSFYDIFAPVGNGAAHYTYDEAREFIVENFSDFHEPLGEFAQMAFDQNWIDSEPRAGKVGGAYCTSFPLRKETRILANFDHTFDGVSTIAHELGHGYHDYVTRELPALLRHYPMTLAETASIFSQFVVFQGALKRAADDQKITLIEGFLQDATQTCVDILSRFYFERNVFAKRMDGDIMADQFSQMMIDAQRATYGDALNEDELHPYMWAVKGHYYSSELSFYNFPYAFGQLFGLGVYQLSQQQENFSKAYDTLLWKTGQDAASAVTETIGCDITTTEFWQQGIDLIGTYVDEFCRLTGYTE